MPVYRYSKGSDAVKLANLAGLSLFEWQEKILKDWLGYKAAGDWVCKQSLLLAPRQQGKSRLLVAYALYLMIVEQVPLTMYSAHEFRTVSHLFRREMRPAVQKLYDIGALDAKPIFRDNTTETSVTYKGCQVLFSSRSAGTGRGFSGDALLIDESYALSPDQDAALRYTISARPDAVVRYASSAGMVTSAVLETLRERGYDKKLPIHDWSASPEDDFSSEKTWARANPSYGLLLMPETVQAEFESPSAEGSFARERLGVWELRLAPVEDIPPVFDPEVITGAWSTSEIISDMVFAVAAEYDRSRAFIAVAGETAEGTAKVELVETQPKVSWCSQRLTQLHNKWNPPLMLFDAVGGLNAVADALSEVASVKAITTPEAIKAQSSFEDALNEGRVILHFDEMLEKSLTNANKRTLKTGSLWDTPRSDALEAPLNAVTLAFYALMTRDKTKKKKRTGKWLAF